MPTSRDLGARYADRLRRTKVEVRKSAVEGFVRTASAKAPVAFERAVGELLTEIDGLVFEDDRKPVDSKVKKEIYTAIDVQLKARPGTFYSIKKGSVESLLAYQQTVWDLYQQIEFV